MFTYVKLVEVILNAAMTAKSKTKVPSDPFEIFHSLRKASGQMDLRFHQFLTSKGLTLTQYLVLNVLSHKESLTPLEIAEELCVSPASITYTCQGLVKDKLVIKKIDKVDRRSMNIKLTAQGKSIRNSLSKSLTKLTKEFFSPLKDRERDQLYTFADKIIENLPLMTAQSR